MNSIQIADRLKFFSHTPGHLVMIPGTHVHAKVFPTALFLKDDAGVQVEVLFDLKGPIDPFTVEQDLERREVRIYGEAQQGYYRLKLAMDETSLKLFFEKTPALGISIGEKTYMSGDVLELMQNVAVFKEPFQERLFLGSSKKKETDSIRRRKDLREVFPLWHLLGAITPHLEEKPLPLLEEAIEKKDKKAILDLFSQIYLAYFSSGLVPRKEDEERQGFAVLEGVNPRSLLQKGSSYIRSLFFQEKEDGLHILPCIIPLFVCGKMIQIKTQSGCTVDIEWTKHRLRRMCIKVSQDQTLKLHFGSDVESFRVKTSAKDRGRIFPGKGSAISVKEGDILSLDLFQK